MYPNVSNKHGDLSDNDIEINIYIYNHLDVHCSFEKLQMGIRRSDQQLCCLMLHSKWDLTGIQTHNSLACFWHI